LGKSAAVKQILICIACLDLIGAAILWAVLRERMAEGPIIEA